MISQDTMYIGSGYKSRDQILWESFENMNIHRIHVLHNAWYLYGVVCYCIYMRNSLTSDPTALD